MKQKENESQNERMKNEREDEREQSTNEKNIQKPSFNVLPKFEVL